MQTGLERIAENTASEVVHTFCKDANPRRTVNQLLKRPVREICRRASVRAAHREVRGYSTPVANGYKVEIVWHRRETRRQTEKTNLNL